MPCFYDITSNDYADFIISNSIDLTSIWDTREVVCIEAIDSYFSMLYTPHPANGDLIPFPYAYVPTLYTLMDTTSMTSSGITQTITQPFLNVRGQGTMIGFIDTGIDYRNPLFQSFGQTTRIIEIWDQNIQTGGSEEVPYGTIYTREQINQALASDDPLAIVPSMDENGHGTFVAGIAAGNESVELDFTGAAPDCSIAVVKLKPAKQNLRDFYLIQDSAIAYQENDILQGIRYLIDLAGEERMPLVIYIGMGTNYGSHEGTTPLGITLRGINQQVGLATVLPAGNETGLGHHYQGHFSQSDNFEDVEVRVGAGERGFYMQLWANLPELYSVGFISPVGQVIQRIPINYETSTTVTLVLEQTEITVHYGISEYGSGSQYVFMRIKNPTAGIWKVRVYNTLFISGNYHIWLPIQGFITNETRFLDPSPDTTITEPGNAHSSLTVGAYNHYDGSIYIHSSRGYNRNNLVKPDMVAPGVDVYGPGLTVGYPDPVFPMVRQSGTSVAAAHAAGAVANLMTWGIVNQNRLNMSMAVIKAILIRGADRSNIYDYPNRVWGYGVLNLYQSFLRLMD